MEMAGERATCKSMIDDIRAAGRLKNWGKWGPDDKLGTFN
jgi:hypothetical protein